jgi:hypothetical protein
VFAPQRIALDTPAPVVGIDRVQVQSMLARNQAQGHFDIRPQLADISRLARIIPGRLNSAAG